MDPRTLRSGLWPLLLLCACADELPAPSDVDSGLSAGSGVDDVYCSTEDSGGDTTNVDTGGPDTADGDAADPDAADSDAVDGEADGGDAPSSDGQAEWIAAAAGIDHACGIRGDGSLACWGCDSHGERDAPQGSWVALSAGDHHTCALSDGGEIACWGADDAGQLEAPSGAFVQLDTTADHTCALGTDGYVSCWGNAEQEQTRAPDDEIFVEVRAGDGFSCARRDNGSFRCWGQPGAVDPAPGQPFSGFGLGVEHACGVDARTKLTCWGENSRDQLVHVDTEIEIVAVAAGGFDSCVITPEGDARCWGDSTIGEDEPDAALSQVSVGDGFACGVDVEGGLWCWGDDEVGETQP